MSSDISPSPAEPRDSTPGASADIRVGDAERQAVLERLNVAHREGQLDFGEFDERTQAAVVARTRGDLSALTFDLPELIGTTGRSPHSTASAGAEISAATAAPANRQSDVQSARANFINTLRAWALVALICNAVWFATFINADIDNLYYWPVWPMVGVGIGVASTYLAYRQQKDKDS